MIVYQRYCCVCMSIFVFHTYTISQYVYVFNTYIHIICAIHPTPKGVGFSHISCNLIMFASFNILFSLLVLACYQLSTLEIFFSCLRCEKTVPIKGLYLVFTHRRIYTHTHILHTLLFFPYWNSRFEKYII